MQTDTPFIIRQLHIPSRLIQGPLAGVSCSPFRVLAHQYGQPGYCSTEMLSAASLAQDTPQKPRFTHRDSREKLLCIQLAAAHPESIRSAITKLSPLKPDLIELNCGCPKPKIRKKGLGSKLIEDTVHLTNILKAARSETDLPLLAKIRLLNNAKLNQQLALCQSLEESKIDALVVHARSWRQPYTTPCDLDTLSNIATQLSIPVIGNGDVCNLTSLKTMLDTGVSGVMISRASVGNPYLFAQLRAELSGTSLQYEDAYPNMATRLGACLLTHLSQLTALEGPMLATLQLRSIGKYYARWAGLDLNQFLPQLYEIQTPQALAQLVSKYFI